MIHKIKAMYDEGNGSSERAIAEALGISRNTVRKYLALDEQQIEVQQTERSRCKELDKHRTYIVHLLGQYPRLSAVKVKRKLEQQVGALAVSSRSMRRYISQLKEEVISAQRRYYEPVLDHVPGVQCQVDPGELREVRIAGQATTVYFVVFVLSYSRLMYVGVSARAITTETLMQLHDEAFRYFGGCPQECVYDQTKLVVIAEAHRELQLNERFAQYATAAGFRIRACEGYDPESKGKVEAGVKYVQTDALYGEEFDDWAALRSRLSAWLEHVANPRLHATTGEAPRQRYEAHERALMRPYLSPTCLVSQGLPGESRKVDKTGLISFQSNKYSVPMAWQSAQVNVLATPDGQLQIYERQHGQLIATHGLSQGKGVVVKNVDHYRDKARQVGDLEVEIAATLDVVLAERLCAQLYRSDPPHYIDKLRAVKRHLPRLAALPAEQLATLADKPRLTIKTLLEYLGAWEHDPERMRARAPGSAGERSGGEVPERVGALSCYANLSAPPPGACQEERAR